MISSMKLFLLVLVPTVLSRVLPRSDLETFSLSAASTAPDPLPTLGNVSWEGTGIQAIGGPLGWYTTSNHTSLKLFIQYNSKQGIAFDSTKSSRTVFLRPEGENGLSEVVLGSPWMEPRPSAVRETNFTIGAVATDSDSDEDTRYYFGYLGEDIDAWSACSADAGEFKLFFGKIAGEPKKGCTKNFSLEIAYTGKNSAV